MACSSPVRGHFDQPVRVETPFDLPLHVPVTPPSISSRTLKTRSTPSEGTSSRHYLKSRSTLADTGS
ncbi:hypothetical protein PCANC_02729 [Puccinia coronata f. sp. avenae]|uniref:Uncharacterized protein n=1 Tax=Puccinia coronata f. sp. avenae TaxID=200324 RepID=A0A2N5VYE4_9BASI|nr:hypothetical protein PCANC_02729 [Puccinia coronata f. sp. avenae]